MSYHIYSIHDYIDIRRCIQIIHVSRTVSHKYDATVCFVFWMTRSLHNRPLHGMTPLAWVNWVRSLVSPWLVGRWRKIRCWSVSFNLVSPGPWIGRCCIRCWSVRTLPAVPVSWPKLSRGGWAAACAEKSTQNFIQLFELHGNATCATWQTKKKGELVQNPGCLLVVGDGLSTENIYKLWYVDYILVPYTYFILFICVAQLYIYTYTHISITWGWCWASIGILVIYQRILAFLAQWEIGALAKRPRLSAAGRESQAPQQPQCMSWMPFRQVMLAADKLLLTSTIRKNATELKGKELALHKAGTPSFGNRTSGTNICREWQVTDIPWSSLVRNSLVGCLTMRWQTTSRYDKLSLKYTKPL